MGGLLSSSRPSCCICAERSPPPPDDVPTHPDDPSSPSPTTPDLLGRTQATLIETQECNAGIISKLQSELASCSSSLPFNAEDHRTEPGLNLSLRVTNSNVLRRGVVIHLTDKGCGESQRKEWDGVTYFGFNVGGQRSEICDVVLPSANPQLAERHSGRHFQIRFDSASCLYFIKDLGKGFGVFMRVDDGLVLSSQTLISAGESFFVLSLLTAQSLDKCLRIKSFSSTSTGEVSYFHPGDCRNTYTVKIGRHQHCDIVTDDGLLSKVQLTIVCGTDGVWRLWDGDKSIDRSSTNGTWMYLHQEHEVENNTIFKVCGTVFEAELWRKA